jgi:REP element-mobilizing transposase RayT
MHPPRLGRLDQIFPGFGIFFITCCTEGRINFLANQEIHNAFILFSQKAQSRNVWVGRYVIMPDHLHFFVDCGNDVSLSDWMKSLKNTLSKTLNILGHEAPHWQKGFFDHLVRSEKSYGEKWDYTHLNPVRAGFVSKPAEWPYQGEISYLPFS